MPFKRSTTTATPDEIFDVWLKKLTEGELKALLYIVRRTSGFGKVVDAVSYDQFLKGIKTKSGKVLNDGCLSSPSTLARALKGLEEKQLIRSRKTRTARGDKDTTVYSLYFEGDDESDDEGYSWPSSNPKEPTTQIEVPSYANERTVLPLTNQTVLRKQKIQETHVHNKQNTGNNGARARTDAPIRATKRNEVTAADHNYTEGVYAVCPVCNMRPCEEGCPHKRF